jgi:hypothetical protein
VHITDYHREMLAEEPIPEAGRFQNPAATPRRTRIRKRLSYFFGRLIGWDSLPQRLHRPYAEPQRGGRSIKTTSEFSR